MAQELGAVVKGAKRKSRNEVLLKLSFSDPKLLKDFLEKYDYRFGSESSMES